ncbi:MAG: hypothetical protein MI723_17040, partial [Caulobacterales bacterium]|nr:hypothetical protein [Caulobacterales bacterium]
REGPMIHDLTKRLIDRIQARTEAGEVEWSEGPVKNSYAFEADGYQICLEASSSSIALVIADGDGRELETLGEEELSSTSNGRGVDYETVVRDIHHRARRVALGTDDAIEAILRAMDE